MAESDDLFTEIQDEGMADIGTAIEFEMDGKQGYHGVIDHPSTATQMLTGAFQGRSEIVIMATRDQFATPPSQRGVLTINSPAVFRATHWERKQVDPFGAAHFAITAMRQLPTT